MSLCNCNCVNLRKNEQGMHIIYENPWFTLTFLEKAVVELVYKFDENSYRECLKKMSRSLNYDSKMFWSINIYIHIYVDTNTDHFTLLVLRVRCNYVSSFLTTYMYAPHSMVAQINC